MPFPSHFNIKSTLVSWLLLLSAFLHGCGSTNACSASSGKQDPVQPLLFFQKTPCYGSCPAYDAMLYEDGSITFVGYAHVPATDTLQLCLPKQELARLRAAMQELDYASLQSSYLSQWTDVPSTYITFYRGGKEVKRIKHQEGGPEKYVHFQEWLHERIMQQLEAK
ncbi:MAG: DUF6438 domain-containing protein [Hymenobacteraceae bacterium]|nr:DUF6438 domain-containing protein [Hymenobacteraceae bacterium]